MKLWPRVDRLRQESPDFPPERVISARDLPSAMMNGHKGKACRIRWAVCLFALAGLLSSATLLRGEPQGLLVRGTQALYRGDLAAASSLAANYLKAHPQSTAALILLARAEMAQGKTESAYQRLLKARRVDPRNIDALYYLAQVCRTLSQVEYESLYDMAPDSARVHQLLAESYRAQQNIAKAKEEYQAALRLSPQSVEILDILGDLNRSEFRFQEAVSFYSRASEIAPHDYESAYGLGACYLYLQQNDEAVRHLQRAVVIDPKSAPARLALGDALLRSGKAPEAVGELKAAVTLEPKMRQAYTLLARAYGKLGRSDEASVALQKSNELSRLESKAREEIHATSDPDAPPSVDAERSSQEGPQK